MNQALSSFHGGTIPLQFSLPKRYINGETCQWTSTLCQTVVALYWANSWVNDCVNLRVTCVSAHSIYFVLFWLLWPPSPLVSPDGVSPSRMVGVSASVNLPLHHKFQKFSSGTGSPGWSRKKGRKTVVVWCGSRLVSILCCVNAAVITSLKCVMGRYLLFISYIGTGFRYDLRFFSFSWMQICFCYVIPSTCCCLYFLLWLFCLLRFKNLKTHLFRQS